MIRNQITLKQIEALVSVADLGTFRKAAAALGTTQPNVSVRIAALEETLQMVLMHRDAGSIRMTEQGKEVLAAARDVLRGTEALLEVADRRDLVTEKLRLGVTELVAGTWLHRFLRALRAEYPALRVELTVDLAQEVESQLISGGLDLTLSNGPFRNASLSRVALGSYRYGWITTPEVASALGAAPSFAAIHAQGMLSHGKNTAASRALRAYLTEQGLPAEEVVHCNSLSALGRMAADGLGIAALPRAMYRGQLAADTLVEVACPWVPEPLDFYASYNASRAGLFIERAAQMACDVAIDDKENVSD